MNKVGDSDKIINALGIEQGQDRMNTDKVMLLLINGFLLLGLLGCHNLAIAKHHHPPLTRSTPLTNKATHLSESLKESGQAKVGQKMPFFSGWRIGQGQGQAYSLRKALMTKKNRYVLNICASWCKPCMVGLAHLAKAKKQFQDTQTELIVLVADQSVHGREIYKRFGFDWAQVVVDEFKTFALRLAPDSKQGSEGLSLPKTIVFNREGVVELIIGVEGSDYIDRLLIREKK